MASAVVKTTQEILQNVEDDTNDALRVNVVTGGAGDGAVLDGVSSSIKATVFDYSNSNPLAVRLTDTNGDYTAAGAGTQYTEDVAASADPVGNALILVRTDTPAGRTTANGDNVAACGTDKGELLVKQTDAVPVTDNGGSLTVDGTVAISALPASTNTIEVVGDAAHDAAVAGNPVLSGFEARSTEATAVGDGDAVRGQASLLGKQVTLPYAIPASTWSYSAESGGITNTTERTIKAAAGVGIRNYLTHIDVSNASATTASEIVIKDGAGGTVVWRGYARTAGNSNDYFFDPPLRSTANTALVVAMITTSTQTYFNAQGFQAAE